MACMSRVVCKSYSGCRASLVAWRAWLAGVAVLASRASAGGLDSLGGAAGILTHAFALAIALPPSTMIMSFPQMWHTGTRMYTCAQGCSVLGGCTGLNAFCLWWLLGGALEHIGTHCNTTPPNQVASRLDPLAARTVFRAGGECPSSGCYVAAEGRHSLGVVSHASLPMPLPLPSPLALCYHDHVLGPICSRWGTHGHFCAGLQRAGGWQWTRCFMCVVVVGGGLEHIGTLSRLGPLASPSVFRAGGRVRVRGAMSQQKGDTLWGGTARKLTNAFALAP